MTESLIPTGIRHVIWDWNATLWDDHEAVRLAANAALAGLRAGPVDAARFRDHYVRPWKTFYERLAGRPLSQDEWLAAEARYHDTYNSRIDRIQPAHDAVEALRYASSAGHTQSVLSMWRQDLLVAAVERLGFSPFLTVVDGRPKPGGGPKSTYLAAHLRTLGLAPHEALVVGDALDDFAAAEAVGTPCVLYTGGTHHPHVLRATGAPVATSLVGALTLGGVVCD